MRFIHTADWQIGMKAVHVGSVGERVRQERLAAAGRVVDMASQHGVDFILVAGDTFEDNAVERLLVQKVGDILGRFDGPVYLIPGNHDPLVPGSVWGHPVWNSHENLYVLKESAAVEIPGGVLYPCPLHEKYSPSDPTSWIDAKSQDQIAVGLAHGTVEGVTDEPDYPIPRDAATRCDLDYLALGHWHSTARYKNGSGAERMAYSGTHETTKFGERDSGNVLLVEINSRGEAPKLASLRTGGLTWESLEDDIRDKGDLARLHERIETFPKPEATLLDAKLTGVLHPTDSAALTHLDQLIQSRFLYGRLDRDGLRPQPEDEKWLDDLPSGVIRQLAGHLQDLSDRSYAGPREEYATPEVATRAMMELYALVSEASE
ncbi:MAG: DNA repair exonuclease [Planctomycetes bacterium]|nr:DNA repair exonuclease [Planctomycetota bacterium]